MTGFEWLFIFAIFFLLMRQQTQGQRLRELRHHSPAVAASPVAPAKTDVPAEDFALTAQGIAVCEKITGIAAFHGLTADAFMALGLVERIRLGRGLPTSEKQRINRLFNRRMRAIGDKLVAEGGDE